MKHWFHGLEQGRDACCAHGATTTATLYLIKQPYLPSFGLRNLDCMVVLASLRNVDLPAIPVTLGEPRQAGRGHDPLKPHGHRRETRDSDASKSRCAASNYKTSAATQSEERDEPVEHGPNNYVAALLSVTPHKAAPSRPRTLYERPRHLVRSVDSMQEACSRSAFVDCKGSQACTYAQSLDYRIVRFNVQHVASTRTAAESHWAKKRR